jgi:LysM repeat protein
VFRAMGEWRNTSIVILLLGMSACSPLEPIIMEPEMSDLQLTVDTLKASLRDTQRTVVELRAEVDARRQELADVQIARAQLEGRIREAERRLTEARHVIDLQREELASSRSEREQVRRTRAALQNQLKQKQVSKVEKHVTGNVSPEVMASPKDGQREFRTFGSQEDALLASLKEGTQVVSGPAPQLSRASLGHETPVVSQSATAPSRLQVLVKSGDTLWSIARRYHTSIIFLMVRNALPSDRIHVGQVLWLTEPLIEEPEHERM